MGAETPAWSNPQATKQRLFSQQKMDQTTGRTRVKVNKSTNNRIKGNQCTIECSAQTPPPKWSWSPDSTFGKKWSGVGVRTPLLKQKWSGVGVWTPFSKKNGVEFGVRTPLSKIKEWSLESGLHFQKKMEWSRSPDSTFKKR